MPYAAILIEIKDPKLKELYDGNSFLLEAWVDGKLKYQRGFKKNLRVFNSARQGNTIIYVPDPVDEPEQGKDFIYLVSLGGKLNDVGPNEVREGKIQDWTGLCSEQNLSQMNCMIDRKNVLYLSVHHAIFAVKINDTLGERDPNNPSAKTKILNVAQSKKGKVQLDQGVATNFRCLCMYDTSESFYRSDDNYEYDSVIAIIDNMTRVDYNNIVCEETSTELEIKLVQQ